MRHLLLAAIAATAFTTAAYAGEGDSEPFPGPNAAVTSNISAPVYAHRDQDPFQYRIAGSPTTIASFNPVVRKDQDPYQYRVAGQVIQMNAPVTGPQSGTAVASTTRGIATPAVAGPGTHG